MSEKMKLKLMAEYKSSCLWLYDETGDLYDEPEPADLPLSAETTARLQKWAAEFDAGLNWDDPGSTPKPTEEEAIAFEQEGLGLWQRLREEVGSDYVVTYHSTLLGRELHDPAELVDEHKSLTTA